MIAISKASLKKRIISDFGAFWPETEIEKHGQVESKLFVKHKFYEELLLYSGKLYIIASDYYD